MKYINNKTHRQIISDLLKDASFENLRTNKETKKLYYNLVEWIKNKNSQYEAKPNNSVYNKIFKNKKTKFDFEGVYKRLKEIKLEYFIECIQKIHLIIEILEAIIHCEPDKTITIDYTEDKKRILKKM